MNNKKNDYFSIRETAKACGIGRTTLQRLTDDNLIKPAMIGENKYHYYNSRNIYDINMIQLMHECGFSKKELKSLDMSPETMSAFADRLQDKINMLTFNMENLRAASLTDTSTHVRTLSIPELRCYTTHTNLGYGIIEMANHVDKALHETIRKGFETNRYYPPFLIPEPVNFLYDDPTGKKYKCKVYIPVITKTSDPSVETVPATKAISVTFHYTSGGNRTYYKMLTDELQDLGLKPASNPRFEALFNPFNFEEDSINRIALRVSVPI